VYPSAYLPAACAVVAGGTETNQRLCLLNTSPDEVIRSLFYNKNNNSLITVSVYSIDNYSSLKCRTTSLECVCLFVCLHRACRPLQAA
jgi:hypothetical protein